LRYADAGGVPNDAQSVLLVVVNESEVGAAPEWARALATPARAVVHCEPRGIGATRWTRKNPPNYVERCHVLLGRTVDTGRVWDVIAAAKYLARRAGGSGQRLTVHVVGQGAAGLIGAYAALWATDDIDSVTLLSPPSTHMSSAAPQFLNVLRVCDVPDALGLIAPRPLTLVGATPNDFARTTAVYAAAGAQERLSIK
jgi:hypothetical protein